jgi:uncharacterized NAD-dependent epimerase/dehydratase family protein
VIRYRAADVVAVLDSHYAGRPLESVLGCGKGIPVVATMAETRQFDPDALLVGIAPVGGQLPEPMRRHIREAICSGLAIISGLHTMLREDAEFAGLAGQHGVPLLDVRDPGPLQRIASRRARRCRVRRVLTVGTDCSVGKMVAALELRDAARRAGLDAAFAATGQTGIMIEGWGIAIDRVISDFAAGAAEWLVEQTAERDIVFIEGQGSITHPGYSGVTCSLIHGTCPDALVLCHCPDRTEHEHMDDCPALPIERQLAVYEMMANAVHPAKVVGLCVNTAGMDDAAAREAIDELAARANLPATDVLRYGCEPVLSAVLAHVGLSR